MQQLRSFLLSYIEIKPGCAPSIRKILKEGEKYCFNHCAPTDGDSFISDLFGKNIFVQAIVGKNGCGKSTLFEIIIRIMNNLAYMLFKQIPENEHSMKVSYINKIYADLGFIYNREIGCIRSRGETMTFEIGSHKYIFGPLSDEFGDEYEHFKIPTDEKIIEITENLFYTIVINYSIHAFYEKNYRNDEIILGQSDGDPWIKCLYHKNDGYRIPIVLNPYRDNGNLDMDTESYLNENRLISILKYSEKNSLEFIENYQLDNIDYTFCPDILLQKFSTKDLKIDVDEEKFYKDSSYRYEIIIDQFKKSLASPKSYARCIIEAYSFTYTGNEDDLRLVGYLYLVYKVLNIAGTYPSYRDYDDYSKMSLCFTTETGDEKGFWEPFELTDFIHELHNDSSHITLKLRQTVNFLANYSGRDVDYDLLMGHPDYDTFLTVLNLKDKIDYHNLDDIMEHMPPSFFEHDITLDRYNIKKEKINERPISISLLSSGELQMLFVLSSIVYHCKNILSITEKNRVKYRCINLLLDEIELCFHPDFQRLFLNNLITAISRMKLNENCGFNILLSTHSPFILSDIPQQNILYLDEGEIENNKVKINPFCANVNDILYQSFFLSKGFMGEFVRRKVLDLVEYLSSGTNDDGYWDAKKARQFILTIGDPLVKEQLMAMYRDSGIVCKQDKIELYKAEIERIEEEQK